LRYVKFREFVHIFPSHKRLLLALMAVLALSKCNPSNVKSTRRYSLQIKVHITYVYSQSGFGGFYPPDVVFSVLCNFSLDH